MIPFAGALAAKSIWAFVKSNWKPIAIALAIAAVLVYHKVQVNKAWYAGRDALKAEQRKEAEKRDADADSADRRVRECADDPVCLRKDDGNRRD